MLLGVQELYQGIEKVVLEGLEDGTSKVEAVGRRRVHRMIRPGDALQPTPSLLRRRSVATRSKGAGSTSPPVTVEVARVRRAGTVPEVTQHLTEIETDDRS